MGPIEARLQREAIAAAGRFRLGGYGELVEHAVHAALEDLETRCLSAGRDRCIQAFCTALVSMAEKDSLNRPSGDVHGSSP